MKQTVKIIDPIGIHARPASAITKVTSTCACEVNFIYNGVSVNAKSILGLMSLGIRSQADVEVETVGANEEESLNAIISVMKETNLI